MSIITGHLYRLINYMRTLCFDYTILLKYTAKHIIYHFCLDVDACAPNPCQHDGTCMRVSVNGVNSYQCFCQSGYEGNNCEAGCANILYFYIYKFMYINVYLLLIIFANIFVNVCQDMLVFVSQKKKKPY